jgi:hypothetical protein
MTDWGILLSSVLCPPSSVLAVYPLICELVEVRWKAFDKSYPLPIAEVAGGWDGKNV